MSKSARRCGAQHISKSKCRKLLSSGALFEVAMSKKCTPLWREAHFEVKINVKNTTCSRHFWTLKCRFAWQAQGNVHRVKSEQKVRVFAEMILRDRCSTSYDLASLFRGRRSSLDGWSGKIAKRIGTRPSALHSTFHFWRTSRRIASFLMFSSSKTEEVSRGSSAFNLADRQIDRETTRTATTTTGTTTLHYYYNYKYTYYATLHNTNYTTLH